MAVAAAALGAVIAWGYLGLPDGRLEPLRTGSLHWQGRFLVLGTLLLAFGGGRRWTAPAVAALTAAELLLFHLPANPPMPQRLANVPNAPIRFLQENLKEHRMAALGRDFPPNLALLHGLSDARVFNPMAPAGYLAHLEPIVAGWWGEMPELKLRGEADARLYRDLGVRYVLTAPGVRLPLPLSLRDRDGWIYEIPSPREPFYRTAETRGKLELGKARGRNLRLRGEGTIASSVYQDGGWRVLLNREPVESGKNGPFLEVRLPSGNWRFDVIYRPRTFLPGCLLAALGLAAGAAWLVPPPEDKDSKDTNDIKDAA